MEQTQGKAPARKRAQVRSEQDIFEAMAAFERAGNISISEFAAMQQVSKATVYNWQKRYRSKATAPKAPIGFIPISIPGGDVVNPRAEIFAECRGIIFYQRVEAAYLKSLLK